MAIAFVSANDQHFGSTSGNTQTISAFSTGAGNLLVAAFAIFGSSAQVSSMTDNQGNTWSHVPNSQVGPNFTQSQDLWYAQNNIGGSTAITVNFTANTNFDIVTCEFSGVSTSAGLLAGSGQAAFVSSPTTPLGPNQIPTISGQLLLATLVGYTSGVSGVSSPWSLPIAVSNNGLVIGYYVVPSTSSQACPYTPTSSTSYATNAAIFDIPNSGPSGKKKGSMFLVF